MVCCVRVLCVVYVGLVRAVCFRFCCVVLLSVLLFAVFVILPLCVDVCCLLVSYDFAYLVCFVVSVTFCLCDLRWY